MTGIGASEMVEIRRQTGENDKSAFLGPQIGSTYLNNMYGCRIVLSSQEDRILDEVMEE